MAAMDDKTLLTRNMKGLKVKMDGAGRARNDSGFDDESPAVSASADDTLPQWSEMVSDWSFKTHSIISQEVIRMKTMTEARRRDVALAGTKAEREAAIAKWKEEMEGMMEITIDLVQCVANDVVETNGSSGSSCSQSAASESESLTSHDLGRILEEELFEEGEKKKIYVVKTKTSTKKPKKTASGKRKKKKSNWEAKSYFTIQVEELQKPEKGMLSEDSEDSAAIPANWQWQKKHLDSPVVWSATTDQFDQDEVEQEEEQPEDIYRDWLRLMRRNSLTDECGSETDINDIFWSISMEPRRHRRISEVLENLPFDDHPDIFFDRCELLEDSGAAARRRMKPARNWPGTGKRPQKSYWNIFYDWKRIFNEERTAKKSQRRQKNLKRRPKTKKRANKNMKADKRIKDKQQQPPLKPPRTRIFEDGLSASGGGGGVSAWYHFPQRYAQLQQQEEENERVKSRTFDNPNFKWFHKPRRNSVVMIENYFSDFLSVFDEDSSSSGDSGRGRRRSRDLVDDDVDEDRGGIQQSLLSLNS